jgi:uncharacterized protein (TIGR00369 family)
MDINTLQTLLESLFPGLMGVRLIEITADKVTASLEVRAELATAGNILHGGAFMAFADTLGAVATLVNLPPGARTTTIESKTNFLGSAAVGTRVIGESTPLHRGRTTMVWQTRITNGSGKLCAVVTQTQLILSGS